MAGNIFTWTLRELGLDKSCKRFLTLYEEFLQQINDKSVRDHLGGLSEESVYSDDVFLKCRSVSHELQVFLMHVFFEADTSLREFTFEYGVF